MSLSKPTTAAVGYALGVAGLALAIRRAGDKAASRAFKDDPNSTKTTSSTSSSSSTSKKDNKDKVGVNAVFMNQLLDLLRICIPSIFSPEAGYATAVAILMIARTWADIWSIDVQTKIEASIISRRSDLFIFNIGKFLAGTLPISFVNNALKYTLEELHLRFRNRLTKHLMDKYMKNYTFYQLSNIDGRISNPDQLLTQDLDLFCASVVNLYSNISKPILDIAIYANKLSRTIGSGGPAIMLGYLLVTGTFLTWLRKPVGRFTIREQQLEGEYRFVNSRVISSSEEIAFYEGQTREKFLILETFQKLMKHLRTTQQFRYASGFIDTIVAKYLATVVGFYVMSRPFIGGATATASHTKAGSRESIEAYYSSGRMLLNMSEAIGRLVLAGRELTRLAGFTARVNELTTALADLNSGLYVRTMVQQSSDSTSNAGETGSSATPAAKPVITSSAPQRKVMLQNGARVNIVDRLIHFENVPLATPNGDILVKALNFQVTAGQNTLIAGPNGCGKSSLFRTLRGIWPQFGGTLHRPSKEKLFYVPQRPYLTLGTLRDQVIYPHSRDDMIKIRNLTDNDLINLLKDVSLESLVNRPGGLDAINDWGDVLSGGEKQRLAMARVFYHRPQFAILDECTSAVSVDVEGRMYTRCAELGITLFTVSHRASLWKYHEVLLRFDGRGNYECRPITDAEKDGQSFGS